jgi:hypothetical protein
LPKSSTQQAFITKASKYARRRPSDRNAGCGVRPVRPPICNAGAKLGILCCAPGRDRTDAENLPLMVGIERASGIATGSGDDQLPRGGFRQIAAPIAEVNATKGN